MMGHLERRRCRDIASASRLLGRPSRPLKLNALLPKKAVVATCIAAVCQVAMRAQTNPTVAERWLAAAEPTPPFVVPASRAEWDARRQLGRAELWKLLGNLPPRPKVPNVEVLSREAREGYTLEKFQFDNGAGSTV